MESRKIQLVAGTTYTLSLPKDWVHKNHLKAGNEIYVHEKDDGTIAVFPREIKKSRLNEIALNIDEYKTNLGQVIFSLYYMGAESITLFSKKELTKEAKSVVRKTLHYMSGTEITYEDKSKITIKVLLDRSKIDIFQVIYRIGLILEQSFNNLLDKINFEEIRINEEEIDRLYHLIAKILTMSLVDSRILASSNIKHVPLIPSYFLLCKRLEHLADNIYSMGGFMHTQKVSLENKSCLISHKEQLTRCIEHLIRNKDKVFERLPKENWNALSEKILKIKSKEIQTDLLRNNRYIVDIEEELVNITFYNKMIAEKFI